MMATLFGRLDDGYFNGLPCRIAGEERPNDWPERVLQGNDQLPARGKPRPAAARRWHPVSPRWSGGRVGMRMVITAHPHPAPSGFLFRLDEIQRIDKEGIRARHDRLKRTGPFDDLIATPKASRAFVGR